MKKCALFVIWILSFVIFISGCGYSFKSTMPSNMRKLYVKPFKNSINLTAEPSINTNYMVYRPGMEIDITNSIINKFKTDGNMKIVKEENADVMLDGELIEYERQPVRYTDNQDIEEYRINLIVNLFFVDAKTKKVIWEEPGFSGYTSYFTTGALAKSETTAVEEARKDLARRIVERTVEGW